MGWWRTLVCAMTAAACGTLQTSPDDPGNAAGDGGSPPDATARPGADGSTTSSCAATHFLCDDFEKDVLGDRWDNVDTAPFMDFGLRNDLSVSPTRSLHARIKSAPNANGSAALEKDYSKSHPPVPTSIRCSFQLYADVTFQDPNRVMVAQVILVPASSSDTTNTVRLEMDLDATSLKPHRIRTYKSGSTDTDDQSDVRSLERGKWQLIAFELTPATDTMVIDIGQQNKLTFHTDNALPALVVDDIRIGLLDLETSDTAAADVTIDDFVCDVK